MHGENPGAAALAIFLLLIAFALGVMAVRGTYGQVWASLKPGVTTPTGGSK